MANVAEARGVVHTVDKVDVVDPVDMVDGVEGVVVVKMVELEIAMGVNTLIANSKAMLQMLGHSKYQLRREETGVSNGSG